MSFAIGIPTLNRFDLLHPALLFYIKDFPNTPLYIVDNGKQSIRTKIQNNSNLVVYEQSQNQGVAGSWNILCDAIFQKHDHALILNDDIYLGRTEFEINTLINQERRDFYVSPRDWAVFILPRKTYKEIGKFDTVFYPAYCEDNDYEYRMNLARMNIAKLPILLPTIYRNSSTMQKEHSISEGARLNRKKYYEKWGGEPRRETYKLPYNKS